MGNLMTNYMEKMSGRATRKVDKETNPIESLRGWITEEFAKITAEVKGF